MAISGTAVAAATAGGVLLYAALTDRSPLAGLREVLSGRPAPVPARTTSSLAGLAPPPSTAPPGTAPGGGAAVPPGGPYSSKGQMMASDILKYLGKPYDWGATGPDSFDCSGLILRVLTDCAVTPPNRRPTAGQYLRWGGADTVAASAMLPGDLIVWGGHIAMYVGNGEMVEAVRPRVRRTRVRTVGAVCRRVRA